VQSQVKLRKRYGFGVTSQIMLEGISRNKECRMNSRPFSSPEDFHWTPQPEAAALVEEVFTRFLDHFPQAKRWAETLLSNTGVRMFDLLDHLTAPAVEIDTDAWATAGFFQVASVEGQYWRHERGMFPPVFTTKSNIRRAAVKVDSVVDFLRTQKRDDRPVILGQPNARRRTADFLVCGEKTVAAVERHGARFSELVEQTPPAADLGKHQESFFLRRRFFDDERQGFKHALALIDAAIQDLGVARTCELFFTAERRYWQSRNRAARVQSERQNRLGIGWANHDHHTYRSSRAFFAALVGVLERLGFQCRERFYAGREAGWGAQVLEQPEVGLLVFADVDLSEDEVTDDFAHDGLLPRDELGTVGLWCALHGEAFLSAGLHHLECQYDFAAIAAQLHDAGVNVMPPFTDFPHLRQAFTRGQQWEVRPERLQAALAHGWISREQAERFAADGALGSHLEILERNAGYKGFNQSGISEIIRDTDPRNAL